MFPKVTKVVVVAQLLAHSQTEIGQTHFSARFTTVVVPLLAPLYRVDMTVNLELVKVVILPTRKDSNPSAPETAAKSSG